MVALDIPSYENPTIAVYQMGSPVPSASVLQNCTAGTLAYPAIYGKCCRPVSDVLELLASLAVGPCPLAGCGLFQRLNARHLVDAPRCGSRADNCGTLDWQSGRGHGRCGTCVPSLNSRPEFITSAVPTQTFRFDAQIVGKRPAAETKTRATSNVVPSNSSGHASNGIRCGGLRRRDFGFVVDLRDGVRRDMGNGRQTTEIGPRVAAILHQSPNTSRASLSSGLPAIAARSSCSVLNFTSTLSGIGTR